MITLKDERRLAKMEEKQAQGFSPDRQIHIDALRQKQVCRERKSADIRIVEIDNEFSDRGEPDGPAGIYVEPAKRPAGEYSAYLASQK